MKHTYFIFFIVAFYGCNSKPEKKVEVIDPKNLITCEGIGEVKLTDTYADLQKKFGDTALSSHENNKAGNFTSIWEGNPKQVNVYWKEKTEPFRTVRYLEIIDKSAPYLTKDSITLGMSMKDVVRKNGGLALTLRNFSVDNPGYITGFNNGDIPKNNPCFEGVLEWTGQRPIDVHELRAFHAQEEVKSFEMIFQRMDIELSTIRVSSKK